MFKVHLGDTPHSLTPQDFDELGRRTQGFSGSDVNVVVKDVLFEPVRKTQEATHFRLACLRLLKPLRDRGTLYHALLPADCLSEAHYLRGGIF